MVALLEALYDAAELTFGGRLALANHRRNLGGGQATDETQRQQLLLRGIERGAETGQLVERFSPHDGVFQALRGAVGGLARHELPRDGWSIALLEVGRHV